MSGWEGPFDNDENSVDSSDVLDDPDSAVDDPVDPLDEADNAVVATSSGKTVLGGFQGHHGSLRRSPARTPCRRPSHSVRVFRFLHTPQIMNCDELSGPAMTRHDPS